MAYVAKIYLTDPSYYRYGYFRADAVPQLAVGTPLYQGSAYCLECHPERSADWLLTPHKAVQCEVCHGADLEHPDNGITLIPADSIRLCSTCHEAMPARPERQLQIVLGEHPFADGGTMPCIECHDPHAPGPVAQEEKTVITQDPTGARPGAVAAMPTTASKCAKCHGKQGEGVKKNPALAGLESAVFTEKMQMYRSGAGDNKIMTRFAKALSDVQIKELADYYESLPAAPPGQL